MAKAMKIDSQELAEEHCQLEARIRDVASLLSDRYSPVSLLTQRLADLRDEISAHFILEERSGVFGSQSGGAQRPDARVQRLLQQHLQLYTNITSIVDDALMLSGSQIERASLLNRFEDFCEALAQHDSEEHRLLHGC